MKLHIHIGLPKTGVTLLSSIFEKSKNVNFFEETKPNFLPAAEYDI